MSVSLTTEDINTSKLIAGGLSHSRSHSHHQKPPKSAIWTHTSAEKVRSSPSQQRKKTVEGSSSGNLAEESRKTRRKSEAGRGKYTVQYVGITNGQIGILSTKRPIPQIPYVEACSRSPLPMIFASESRRRLQSPTPSIKLLKSELSYIQDRSRRLSRRRPPTHSASTLPKQSEEDEYVINRYSFPRGLVATRKRRTKAVELGEEIKRKSADLVAFELRYELDKRKKIPTPRMRRGCSGWMLSSSKIEDQPILHKIVRHRSKDRQVTEPGSISGDMYLKYLQMKSSPQPPSSKSGL